MDTIDPVPHDRRERLRALRRALRSLPAILWDMDRRHTALLLAVQAFQALAPLAQLWVAKLIVDRLVAALHQPHPLDQARSILLLVAIELAIALAGVVAREVVAFQRQVLAERLIGHVTTRIIAHTQTLDLETLERPAFYDHLRRIEEGAFYRPAALLFQLLAVLQGAVTLVVTAVLLARLQPLILPLLLLAGLPYAMVQSGAAVALFTLSTGQTSETRRARYFSHLLTTDSGAREIRVFGLGDYLLGRYRAILQMHERRTARLARQRALRSIVSAVLPATAYAGILALLALQVLRRAVTVGDVTLYLGLVLRSQDVLQQMMIGLSSIVENSLFLADYTAFLALQPGMREPAQGWAPPSPIERGLRFENVSYRYRGAARDALSGVTLEIKPGETVAIVGENGAGKTTLVKMLTRLYEPDGGRITVDGYDLRDLDAGAWRRQIAVIFQDFIHYYLTAAENIGFGQIEALDDQGRIRAAARQGGAEEVIERLPGGYGSMLGRWFDQGVQLSGGEWQRIALARAFMRDAPILVLDEPTASLDARAESQIFCDFREHSRGRTVLLISHRFSTVRVADRIYVLEDGGIVESGHHDDLMRAGGRYAELFQLQAAGYR
ncbi:MAG TPA: ABC transporter ATP-binding protein [Chloroflexota bacterium]|nr:ABC transporter ATP-binding protein [Chloroflexota bacterium]